MLVKTLTGMTYNHFNEELEKTNDEDKVEMSNDDSTKNEVESVLSKLAESALADHETVRKSISTFKENMGKLLKFIDQDIPSKNLPMFVFIDELDRCRPSYAIELLENIKHIFDIPGIVFVIATDSKQLSHSINAVYGQNFASERYLKRFFDQEYNLIKPDNYAFAQSLFELHGITKNEKLFSPLEQEVYIDKDINVELFTLYASFFKLGLRDQEQVATVLSAIVLTWQTTDSIHLGYLLFLIMLKQRSDSYFYMYVDNDKKGSFINTHVDQFDIDTSIQYQSNTIDYEFRQSNAQAKSHFILTDLIGFYINLLDKNIDNLYDMNRQPYRVKSNIIQKLQSSLPASYSSQNPPPAHNLNMYFSLVLQAGQFS